MKQEKLHPVWEKIGAAHREYTMKRAVEIHELLYKIQQTRASLRRSAIVAMTLGVVALILAILSILSKP